MREVKLPSGAVLKIQAAPFMAAKALYQAILKELRTVTFNSELESMSVLKDVFCSGFSSLEIERCLGECLKRCTYNANGTELKIDNDTFEPVDARQDYMTVCIEVAKENVGPFVKSLYAEYQALSEMIAKSQA